MSETGNEGDWNALPRVLRVSKPYNIDINTPYLDVQIIWPVVVGIFILFNLVFPYTIWRKECSQG